MPDDATIREILRTLERAANDPTLAGLVDQFRASGMLPHKTLKQMRAFMTARLTELEGVDKETARAYAAQMDRLFGDRAESVSVDTNKD